MLRLELFGSGRASYRGHVMQGFPAQAPCLLFCWLVVYRGRVVSRERLAGELWPDCDGPDSLKRLRNALWRLRTGMRGCHLPADDYLIAEDGGLMFPGEGQYWLDVESFETTVMRHLERPGASLTGEQAEHLASAADLYQGELLEGLYEDWCLHERERLHLLYLNTLDKLMAYHEADGSYAQGLAFGQRALGWDDTREGVHRQMMRLHWLEGDRSAALAQYERCCEVLHDTLGLAPMPETTALHLRILNADPLQPYPPTLPPRLSREHVDTWPTWPLLDAIRKLEALQSALHDMDDELQTVGQQLRAMLDDAASGKDHTETGINARVS